MTAVGKSRKSTSSVGFQTLGRGERTGFSAENNDILITLGFGDRIAVKNSENDATKNEF